MECPGDDIVIVGGVDLTLIPFPFMPKTALAKLPVTSLTRRAVAEAFNAIVRTCNAAALIDLAEVCECTRLATCARVAARALTNARPRIDELVNYWGLSWEFTWSCVSETQTDTEVLHILARHFWRTTFLDFATNRYTNFWASPCARILATPRYASLLHKLVERRLLPIRTPEQFALCDDIRVPMLEPASALQCMGVPEVVGVIRMLAMADSVYRVHNVDVYVSRFIDYLCAFTCACDDEDAVTWLIIVVDNAFPSVARHFVRAAMQCTIEEYYDQWCPTYCQDVYGTKKQFDEDAFELEHGLPRERTAPSAVDLARRVAILAHSTLWLCMMSAHLDYDVFYRLTTTIARRAGVQMSDVRMYVATCLARTPTCIQWVRKIHEQCLAAYNYNLFMFVASLTHIPNREIDAYNQWTTLYVHTVSVDQFNRALTSLDAVRDRQTTMRAARLFALFSIQNIVNHNNGPVRQLELCASAFAVSLCTATPSRMHLFEPAFSQMISEANNTANDPRVAEYEYAIVRGLLAGVQSVFLHSQPRRCAILCAELRRLFGDGETYIVD